MKPTLACILLFSLVVCTSCKQWPEPKQTQEVVYLNNWQEKWKQEMLLRCSKEVAILSIAIYDSKMQGVTGLLGYVGGKTVKKAYEDWLKDCNPERLREDWVVEKRNTNILS